MQIALKENKEKILKEVEGLFMRYGFKSVTMDDVAHELGVSKKTLYQFFEDKNELVDQVLKQHLSKMETNCSRIWENDLDAISSMLEITEYISNMKKAMNPGILYDLKKYFKPSWDRIAEHKKKFTLQSITMNIEKGKSKGLYLKEIDTDLIAAIYVHLIDFLIDPDIRLSENFDEHKVHFELVKYHMRAICTEKGMKILNDKLKKY